MKKIGLALSSGGSRGLAHIGVIKALLENNIPIDIITGSSAGALIGGFYAAWHDIDRLEKFVLDLNYRKLFSLFLEPPSHKSLIRGNRAFKFLSDNLGQLDIENLPLKFRAVSTDAVSSDPYIIDHGDLITAIRSSCAIPLIFQPVCFQNKTLIDGAASCPVPAEIARLQGANLVIAVNLYHGLFPQEKIRTTNSLYLLLNNLAKENLKYSDFVISPITKGFIPLDFVGAKKLINVGYQAALPMIPEIKKSL